MNSDIFELLVKWGTQPWFRLGETEITLFRILGLIFILLFFWWFSMSTERVLRQLARRGNVAKLSDSAVFALTRIARYMIWIIGSIVGLTYLGIDLASLAFVGGAMGIGVGFGLQNIFSNLMSGIIILLEKTLKVGDFVDLQSGIVGKVSEIGLRYTRVTTNDNVDVIVPNSEFINGRVTNWTFNDALRRMHISFGVAYTADKQQVRDVVTQAALRVDGTINEDLLRPAVWLVNFGDNSLNFELVVWVNRALAMSPSRTHADYMWEIESALKEAGIEIPFPQRDLHVRSGRLNVTIDQHSTQEEGLGQRTATAP